MYAAGRIGADIHTRSGKDQPAGDQRAWFDHQVAHALRTQGVSLRMIAKRLNVSAATVLREMRLPKAA